MKLVSWYPLQLAVVFMVISSPLARANSCPEDARVCDNGRVVQRDPQQNCAFPECPSSLASDGSTSGGVIGCKEDALICPNGESLSRVPSLNCSFPACSQDRNSTVGSGVAFLQERNFPTPTPSPVPTTSTAPVKAASMLAVAVAGVVCVAW